MLGTLTRRYHLSANAIPDAHLAAASDVIYVETYTDGDYLDSQAEVQAYTALWNRLQAAAMGQVESRNLIIRLADEKEVRS